jgi:hypothetical protein
MPPMNAQHQYYAPHAMVPQPYFGEHAPAQQYYAQQVVPPQVYRGPHTYGQWAPWEPVYKSQGELLVELAKQLKKD